MIFTHLFFPALPAASLPLKLAKPLSSLTPLIMAAKEAMKSNRYQIIGRPLTFFFYFKKSFFLIYEKVLSLNFKEMVYTPEKKIKLLTPTNQEKIANKMTTLNQKIVDWTQFYVLCRKISGPFIMLEICILFFWYHYNRSHSLSWAVFNTWMADLSFSEYLFYLLVFFSLFFIAFFSLTFTFWIAFFEKCFLCLNWRQVWWKLCSSLYWQGTQYGLTLYRSYNQLLLHVIFQFRIWAEGRKVCDFYSVFSKCERVNFRNFMVVSYLAFDTCIEKTNNLYL